MVQGYCSKWGITSSSGYYKQFCVENIHSNMSDVTITRPMLRSVNKNIGSWLDYFGLYFAHVYYQKQAEVVSVQYQYIFKQNILIS